MAEFVHLKKADACSSMFWSNESEMREVIRRDSWLPPPQPLPTRERGYDDKLCPKAPPPCGEGLGWGA